MSGETQSHSRRRRERKKKKGDSEAEKLDSLLKSLREPNEDDSSCKEDEDHDRDDKDVSHHESSGGILSTVVFFLLLGGLVVLTAVIFIELKGSKEVGPSITESRYASILGDLVDEHLHEHEEEEEHLTPHLDRHDDGEEEEEEEGGEGDERDESFTYPEEDVAEEEEEESIRERRERDVIDDDQRETNSDAVDATTEAVVTDTEDVPSEKSVQQESLEMELDNIHIESSDNTEITADSEAQSVSETDELIEQMDVQAVDEEQLTEAQLSDTEQSRFADNLNGEVVDHGKQDVVDQTEVHIVEGNAVEEEIPASLLGEPLSSEPRVGQSPSEEHLSSEEQLPIMQPPSGEQLPVVEPSGDQLPVVEPSSREQLPVVEPPSEEQLPVVEPPSKEQLPVVEPPSKEQLPVMVPSSEEQLATIIEPPSKEVPVVEQPSEEPSIVKPSSEEPNILQPLSDESPALQSPSDESEQQKPPAADASTYVKQTEDPIPNAARESTEPPPDPWAHYEQADITNHYDYEFHEELDHADEELEKKSAERAKKMYESLLRRHPQSPRATYGKAKALDKISEEQRSNALLESSIAAYEEILGLPDVPDRLFRLAGERCADRMRFRGFTAKSSRIQEKLVQRFPDDTTLRNQLAVSYLMVGQNKAAKKVLQEVLRITPDDGFAKVHYGFILKTDDNDYKTAIKYMQEGIDTGEPGTIDGRFFFHLGDALAREGFPDRARKVYEDGVKRGLFLSVYQRSLYNVDTLTGRPWWTPEQTKYGQHLKKLEDHWQVIQREGLALLDEKNTGFLPESENLRDTGIWKQFELFARGRKMAANCARAPRTCQLIDEIPDAAGCKRGQVKFSVVHPGTHVWAHTGPTNCRIRAHLGLVVPNGARIRVANETRSWIEGKFIIFDDSFEHEVWHNGNSLRLVLIVDFWHPELTQAQKQTLSPI